MKNIKISYGFVCWACGKRVLASRARCGVWFVSGNPHCTKECATHSKENR